MSRRRTDLRIIAAALIAIMLLGGCGAPEKEEHRMRVLQRGEDCTILVDTDTGVCYLRTSYGGLCVMVDHTGKPYIANGWRDWGGNDED